MGCSSGKGTSTIADNVTKKEMENEEDFYLDHKVIKSYNNNNTQNKEVIHIDKDNESANEGTNGLEVKKVPKLKREIASSSGSDDDDDNVVNMKMKQREKGKSRGHLLYQMYPPAETEGVS